MINILIIFVIFTINSYSQEMDNHTQMDSLKILKNNLQKSLDSVNIKIKEIENNNTIVNKTIIDNDSVLITLIECPLRNKPVAGSKILLKIPKDTKLKKVNHESNYYEVKYNNLTGFVNEIFFKKAIPYQNNFISLPNVDNSSNHNLTSDKNIHIGPRGGKYYINSKGNKTYIKRK